MIESMQFIALLVGIVVLSVLAANYIPKLAHLAIKRHWPLYRKYGEDEYNFDLYDEQCSRCK